MTQTNQITVAALALSAMALAFMVVSYPRTSLGSAPSGLPASIATSSVSAITANGVNSVFATSTSCAARVISTTQAGVMISFSDERGFVPSATQGHWQGASTTEAYDSGLYGCGMVRVYSGTAQTITVSESR